MGEKWSDSDKERARDEYEIKICGVDNLRYYCRFSLRPKVGVRRFEYGDGKFAFIIEVKDAVDKSGESDG